MSVNIGEILDGKVVNIMNFGAFVELPDGKNGLVHISEIALGYVTDIREHLNLNDNIRVKVIGIDEKGKISLSIKKALAQEPKKQAKTPANINWSKSHDEGLSFEDKLNKFKVDSDEKMQDLKRSFESKRGGGYRRSSGSY